jgi:hypothetical protein
LPIDSCQSPLRSSPHLNHEIAPYLHEYTCRPAGVTNITTTSRDPHRGHRSRSDNRPIGKALSHDPPAAPAPDRQTQTDETTTDEDPYLE